MTPAKRGPFKDLIDIQEQMNQLLEEGLAHSGSEELRAGQWVPPVDIYETPENLVINVELPGLGPSDVILELKDNRLTLAGERKFLGATSGENYLMAERAYGPFRRSFSMSNNIDGGKITAKFNNGILEINLAKKEESKSRSIPVQTD